jgi:hypothetical protein
MEGEGLQDGYTISLLITCHFGVWVTGESSTEASKHYIYLHITTFSLYIIYILNKLNEHYYCVLVTLVIPHGYYSRPEAVYCLNSSQRLGSPSPSPRVKLNVCLTLWSILLIL